VTSTLTGVGVREPFLVICCFLRRRPRPERFTCQRWAVAVPQPPTARREATADRGSAARPKGPHHCRSEIGSAAEQHRDLTPSRHGSTCLPPSRRTRSTIRSTAGRLTAYSSDQNETPQSARPRSSKAGESAGQSPNRRSEAQRQPRRLPGPSWRRRVSVGVRCHSGRGQVPAVDRPYRRRGGLPQGADMRPVRRGNFRAGSYLAARQARGRPPPRAPIRGPADRCPRRPAGRRATVRRAIASAGEPWASAPITNRLRSSVPGVRDLRGD
jgi:hypothetical protein